MTTAPRRRRVTGNTTTTDTAKAVLAVKSQLATYSSLQKQLQGIAKDLKVTEEKIIELMKEHTVGEVETDGWSAKEVETKYNAVTEVDAEGLYKAYKKNGDLKSFWGAVKPVLARVKESLSLKEIASVSTVTPGGVSGTKIKIAPVKIKVSK